MSELQYFVSGRAGLHVELNNKILLGKISTPDISHMGNINSTLQYKSLPGTYIYTRQVYYKPKNRLD